MFFLNKIVNGGFVNGAKQVIHGVTKVGINVAGNAVGGVFGDAHLGTDLVQGADYAQATANLTAPVNTSPSLQNYVTGVGAAVPPVTNSLPLIAIVVGGLLLLFLLFKSGNK